MDATGLSRWLNDTRRAIASSHPLSINLDLPDLVVQIEEEFDKTSIDLAQFPVPESSVETAREVVSSSTLPSTFSSSVSALQFSRASSIVLLSSSTMFSSTILHGIEAEKVRRRFG